MRHLVPYMLVLAWVAACDIPSGPRSHEAAAGVSSFERVHNNLRIPPPAEPQFNACPPQELVQIVKGRFHVNQVIETGTDGTQTFKVHFNAQGFEGIGLTSGDKYRIMDNDKVEVVITETTFDLVSHDRFRLIRQGSLDNLWLRIHTRLTDPEGEPEITRLEFECRG
jgi:hypothetical protein